MLGKNDINRHVVHRIQSNLMLGKKLRMILIDGSDPLIVHLIQFNLMLNKNDR